MPATPAQASRSGATDGKRSRILAAALEVCQRTGVDGARMEEVAALAQVSKGTLYRYFASKEELLLATILDSYEQFRPLFEAAEGAGGPPRQRLEALMDGLVTVLEAVAPRMNVHYQAWGLVANAPALQAELHGFLRRFHEARGHALENVLRAGQWAGTFRPGVDVEAVAEAIQALLSGFLYRATFDPERARPELLRRSFDALVLDALQDDGSPHGRSPHG